MQKSESIAALAAALAKAQAAMRHAAKDASNPHFRSKYADLPAVVEAIREPFGQHFKRRLSEALRGMAEALARQELAEVRHG